MPSTPACPKICCLYAVAERHNNTLTQHRHRTKERERERERERETALTSNEYSYSPFQSTTLPSSLSLFSVTHSHSNHIFSQIHLPLQQKKVYYLFCIPFHTRTSTSLQFFLLPLFPFHIFILIFGNQFFDYIVFSAIQLSIGSRHPSFLLLSPASELSIYGFHWALIELGICKICGFVCWWQKVLILVVGPTQLSVWIRSG